MIRAIIVDDEKHCRDELSGILKMAAPDVDVVAQAASVADAVSLIGKFRPDLLFLDISLGDGLGFDVLEKVNYREFRVIFITAHDEYAIKAFRFNALDYILKPVDRETVTEAVAKVRIQPLVSTRFEERFESLIHKNQHTRKKIALPAFESITMVNISDIIRCSSDGSYTTFYTIKGNPIVVSRSMKEYDELLTPMNFFRVHQSHLVNLNYVHQYLKEDGGILVMEDGSRVEVSRRRKEALMAVLLKPGT
jgi:two-component system, LytTR family, response regulator